MIVRSFLRGRPGPILALGLALTLWGVAAIYALVTFAWGGFLTEPKAITRDFGSPESIGRLFLTDHLLAFEITSIVLFIAAVGGVVLGAHARAAENDAGT